MIIKIRTLILDDDPDARIILSRLVQLNPYLQLVDACASVSEAYAVLAEKEVELMICDIEMPEMTGLQFVRSMQQPPLVIFVTSHSHYALACYEVSPVDFLTKPVDPARFLTSIEKVRSRLLAASDPVAVEPYFFVKDGTSYQQIRCTDVLYMQADDNFVKIVTPTQTYLSVVTIAKLEDTLSSDLFVRVHRSYLVQRTAISNVRKNDLILTTKQVIPIGDQYRSAFQRKHILGKLIGR